MYKKHELSTLFEKAGVKIPSVSTFNKILKTLPPEQQQYYRRYAFTLGMTEFMNLSDRYKTFLIRLVKHKEQHFLDFLLQGTLLGAVRYTPRDPAMFIKMFNLLEKYGRDHKPSYDCLSLAVLLGFDYRYKISTFGNKIAESIPSAADLWEWYERVQLTNGEQPTEGK